MNSKVMYKTYTFSSTSQIVKSDLNVIHSDSVLSIKYDDTSAYGTGTIIYNQDNLIAVLSSAHIFNHPDTLITYFEPVDNQRYISSISVKVSEKHYSSDMPNYITFTKLVQDIQHDIIILAVKLKPDQSYLVPALPYPFGSSSELNWGTMVFLAGYPKGYKMLTRGSVSEPGRNNNSSFLIDTMFNYGFSGGLAVAIRQDPTDFEIVGIATSATADIYNVLVPDPSLTPLGSNSLYRDDIYNRQLRVMNYGITIATPVDAVKKMIVNNKNTLMAWGFDMQQLFRETR